MSKQHAKANAEKPGDDVPSQPVRKKVVYAGKCPRNADHPNTRVYRTHGATRYCVCDDCGETWKKVAAAPAEDKAEA